MTGNNRRQHERYRVHLRVRFSRANDFVDQFARNLSYGGLFVKGVDTVDRLDDVLLDVELPGYGTYRVKGTVAHVTAEAAAADGPAGVGVQLVDEPAEFRRALDDYLAVLGARRDADVLVDESLWSTQVVQDGGFRTVSVSPKTVDEALRATENALALVCAEGEFDEFRAAVGAASSDLELVAATADLDATLTRLDEILRRRVR